MGGKNNKKEKEQPSKYFVLNVFIYLLKLF